jgi:hypothetical protein
MKCEQVKEQLPLYLYGELSFDQEEAFETHLDGCAECRREVEVERAMHAALDGAAADPDPALLWSCRDALRERLAVEPVRRRWSWASLLGWNAPGGRMFWQGAGAMALIAVSFLAGRSTHDSEKVSVLPRPVMTEPVASRVRYVEPTSDGRVQIVLDETRQRTLTGALDDDRIRGLLLAAAKDPNDPGLRVESVGLLQSRPGADVRDALMYALRHDTNAGVRLKALGGLKSFAGDPELRRELAQVLLQDSNPGVRTQAIDLLMQGSERSALEKPLAGVLQDLLLKENNSYVRQRCQRALEDMKASAETY